MNREKRARRALADSLEQERDRQAQVLEKVEKARKKLEKHNRKLQKLESKIAELERQTQNPEAQRLGQAEDSKAPLRHARLIFNPKAKGAAADANRLEDIVGRLRTHGIIADIGLKTSGKAARELAREAVDKGEDMVIVAAGDGTIEEVASQLVGSNTRLGIVPTGTMNNLARSLGVPLELEDACTLLGMGVTRRIDIGRVIANEKPKVEYFLESAGVGLSALVAPAGQAAEKGRWHELPKVLRKLIDFKPALIEVQFDDGELVQTHAQVVSISNAPMLGMNTMIAPDAKMDDGLLDVGIYDKMSKADLAAYFLSASNGKRPDSSKVSFHRARRIRIRSSEPLEANSDMDVLEEGKQVWEVQVIPQAISVVAGNGIGLSMPMEAAPSVPPLTGPQPASAAAPAAEPARAGADDGGKSN